MSIDFTISSQLAADLAREVDPNEASKVLAYLRSQKNGRALFDYLQTIEQHGKAVIRSRQTLRYYQEMHEAFKHHLRQFQDDPETMAKTLGWAIRLMTYYKQYPDRKPDYTAQAEKRGTTSESQTPPPSVAPEAGDVVTGQIVGPYDDRSYQVIINKAAQNVTGVLPKNYGRTNGGIRAEVTRVVKREGQVYALLKPVKRAKE